MPSVNRQTFSRAEKLKSQKQIDLLFREGKSFFAAPVKCFYRFTGLPAEGHSLPAAGFHYSNPAEGEGEKGNGNNECFDPKKVDPPREQRVNIKCGVSVSKRNFRKSVDRNRIKRLLREAYRLHKQSLFEKMASGQATLEVFFVFTDRTLPAFGLVEEKMRYCLRRLGKIAEGSS